MKKIFSARWIPVLVGGVLFSGTLIGLMFVAGDITKNKDFKKSKSQFLVFLTPKVHESSSAANQELKDAFNLQEVRQ